VRRTRRPSWSCPAAELPDGLTLRDPDGVEFVLLSAWHDVAIEPSAWLYWHH
jgi:hypothetical protein